MTLTATIYRISSPGTRLQPPTPAQDQANKQALSIVAHFQRSISLRTVDDVSKPFIYKWWFGCIVSCTVVINAAQLGFEPDYPDLKDLWYVLENVVTFVFLLELISKLYVLRRDFFYCAWNWMDFVLTLLSIADTWILAIAEMNLDPRSATVLRGVRLLRLLRILKLFQRFRQFAIVIAGVIDAARHCLWVGVVLAVAIYAFAIFSVRFIGHGGSSIYPGYTSSMSEVEQSGAVQSFNPFVSFGTMPRAMLTLLNVALLDGWGDIARPMILYQPWLLPLFIFFVLFVTLGVMNVIMSMICDSVLSRAREIKMSDMAQIREKKLRLLDHLHGLVKAMDRNGDGNIDPQELKKAINEDPEVKALIDSIELPAGISAEELLLLLDTDGDGLLSYDNFIQSFYRLIDGGNFQQLCLMQMNVNTIKHHVVEMTRNTMKLQEAVAAAQREERSLGGNKAVVADPAAQTQRKLVASTRDATEPQQSLAEELSETSEDEDNYETFHQRCSHWQQSLASMEDATATMRLKLSRCVEQVSAALLEAEKFHGSILPSPGASSMASASTASTHAQSPSRSSGTRSKDRPHSSSVARWKLTSPLNRNPCSETGEVACKWVSGVEECPHTLL